MKQQIEAIQEANQILWLLFGFRFNTLLILSLITGKNVPIFKCDA
jgi:hypothetical protein